MADLAGAGNPPKNGLEKIQRIGLKADFASRRPVWAGRTACAVDLAIQTGLRANHDRFVLVSYGL